METGSKRRHRVSRHHVKSILQIIGVFLALLFCASDLPAGPVGKRQAERLLNGWLKAYSRPLGANLGDQIKKTEGFADENGQPLYYVIYLEPSGFVIVSGDDMVEPIICFAESGSFDASDDNPLGVLVSGDLPARIGAVRQLQAGAASVQAAGIGKQEALQKSIFEAQTKWIKLSAYNDTVGILGLSNIRVEPLVQSKWGQANIGGYINYPACYNYYTPPYEPNDPNNYPCGCVATAMAQLMRYHQYPTTYNWSNMPLEPDLSTTEAQRQAIGQLCYDAAESINTTYGPDGSEAFLGDGSEQLNVRFAYSNSVFGTEPVTGAGLNGIINPNLDAGRPVLLGLGISSGDGGHALICDGYGYNAYTLYHHLNMGWNGTDDAWYALPIVDAYYYYDVIDNCVYNIFTSGSGEIISGRVTDMAGNPIPNVTIVAQASGTGPYQTTTNANGIYALVNVPSNKSYTVTATKAPYLFINQNASTGMSSDNSSTSGNVWGVTFVSQNESPPIAYNQSVETLSGTTETIILNAADDGLPDPPGRLKYIIAKLPKHGTLTDPTAGKITDVPHILVNNGNQVEYKSCSYFAEQDSFEFKANDYGTAPQGGDSEPATVTIDVNNVIYTTFAPTDISIAYWPLWTSYHQSRTQVIYLSGEIGDAKDITDLALDIYEAPGQTLNNWTIRMKHTSRSDYSSPPYFETSGWTIVYQSDELPTPIGWRYFRFQNVFEYNGTDNVLIDFSFNNSFGSTDGTCKVSDTGSDRVFMSFANSTHGDPLSWTDFTAPGLYVAQAVPNIKLIGMVPGEPIAGDFEPDCDVDFEDFAVLANAWLSEPGQPNWNVDCDISEPADNIINCSDLAVLAGNWLEDAL